MSHRSQQQIQILHVDDEPNIADLTQTFLERESDRFTVETATSADEGLEILADRPPDCVVSDYNMPGMDGIEFLQAVREDYPDLPFILYTGKGSEAVAGDAIAADVTDYLQKDSGTGHYTVLANRISNAVGATRSAAEAEERRHRLEQILKTAPGCVVQCDADGQFVFANERAEEVLGLRSDEVTQRTYNDPEWELQKLNGEPISDEELPFRRVCDTGETVLDAMHTVVWPDGSRKILSVNAAPLFNETGDVESVVASLNDITEQRERQRELRLFKQAIEDAADGVAIIDDEERYVYVDQTHVDMYGFADKDQLLGNTWRKLYDNDEIERLEREAFPALEADGHWHGTVTGSRPDGSTFPAELSLTAVGAGRVVCTVRDDTERRQREQRFQALVEESSDIISIVDADGQFQYQSPSIERILGYDPGETIGDMAWEYIHPDDRQDIVETFEKWKANTDARDSVRYRARHADGSWQWIEARGAEQFDNPAVDGYVINGRDITAQKESEQQLVQTQELLSSIEALADVGAWEYDSETGNLTLTTGVKRICGIDPDADLSLTDTFEFFHPNDRGRLRDQFETCQETGKPYEIDVRVVTEGGGQRWVTARGERVQHSDTGSLVRGYIQDITEQTEQQQELERRNDLFEKAQAIADMGTWVHDIERGTLTWTDQVYDIHGVSEDFDPSVDDVEALYHPEDQPKLREAVNQPVTAGEPYDLEVRMTARDDGTRWIRTIADPQVENGDVVRVHGTVHDITERKQHEQKLELVETLFEHAEECQFIIDVAGSEFELRHANDYYKRTVGLSPGEPVSGQTPTELFGETSGQEILDRYTECVETCDSITYTVEAPVPEDGTVYRTILTPVGTDDDVTHIVGTARDITDHKRREEKLNRQNNRLEEFASVVSHDLRNPLRVADGKLELAQTECDSAHLNDVTDAIDRCQALIEDLLTLAREGEAVEEVEPVTLADVAENSWQTIESQSTTLETRATQTIQADQSRFTQLFENLYRNAIEHGGDNVTVSVGTMDDGFYVADTGPGISEDDREEVFEAGYSTNEDGTGFGLRIVKQVADAHGWEITVTESEQGGARFEITGVDTPE